ncbi:sulfurtransferase-like selenium metabolism protein YedF [Caloramator sp. E03]|uniref:sulfurtransferase-like selenium metabolism protein YedF n=1 Tax=Caloramator sp. E03 TaxID=2576307 RepID=UPI001110F18B|nr:sulfurtransferase-like selenium metabolism protein YedF [Caloramator sp. E03]QCX33608.1 sulfurtransferase-like selenium metabolism protein YedF [Caloramator sp. E03]
MKKIDCRGLACPKPVIMTKKELESMESGELEVIVDNEAAKENVSKLAKNMGLNFEVFNEDKLFHIVIKKDFTSCDCKIETESEKIVILVSSDRFGSGDDKLGAALMKSYLYALTESEIKPKTMIFVNGGARLTIEGSDVLESIKTLESSGVEILVCGTCLDFYGIKDKLAVGNITNMYTIVEKMNSASNTIKL